MSLRKGGKRSAKSPETLLVTGCGGFIGRRFCAAVARAGINALFVDRPQAGRPASGPSCRFAACDITSPRDVASLKGMGGDIVLVHMAALVPHVPSKEDEVRRDILRVNLGGTVNLLETLGSSLKRVMYISTLEVYGAPLRRIDEDHPTSPLTYYGISKLYAENYCRVFCAKNGIPFTSLRFSSVYGPGEDYDRAVPNFIRSAIKGGDIRIFGDGSELRDYIYIDDAVNAVLSAVSSPEAAGIINVASGKSFSIAATARLVKRETGSASRIIRLPRKKQAYDVVFSVTRMKRLIGHVAVTPFQEGVRREIEWFKSERGGSGR